MRKISLIFYGKKVCSLALCMSSTYSVSATEIDYFNIPLAELAKLEITAVSKSAESITEAPGIISVITAHDIKRFGAKDIHDLLRRVTSVIPETSVLFPDNVISIRGQHSSIVDRRSLLLLDERPIRDTNSGGSNATFHNAFPLAAIERIEVIRGPGSVLYGSNAFSGIINIITKTTTTSGGQLKMGGGSFSTFQGDGVYHAITDHGSIMLAAKSMISDGWEFEATDRSGSRDSMDMKEHSRGITLRANLQNFTLNMFQGKTKQDYLGANQQWPAEHYDRNTHFIDLSYQQEWSSNWRSNFNLTYNRNNRANQTSIDIDTYNILYEATLQGNISNKLSATFGASYLSLRGEDKQAMAGFEDFKDSWKNSYGQLHFMLSKDITLVAGLQYNDTGIDTDTSYRGSLVWKITEPWGIKILYGEAFRSPYMAELYSGNPFLAGNENLVPETIATTDLQLFYYSNKYRFEASYFHSHIDEEISLTPTGPGRFEFINSGGIDSSGYELNARAQLSNKLDVQASYSYQSNDTDDGIKDSQIVANSLFKLGLSYRFDNNINLGLFDSYFGEPGDHSKLSNISQERNNNDKAYHYLTLNLDIPLSALSRKTYWQGIHLSLYGDNLLESDAVYQPDLSRPNVNAWPKFPGRAFYLNIEFPL